jgi:hypothetical protein
MQWKLSGTPLALWGARALPFPRIEQVPEAFPDGDPAHVHGAGKLIFGGKFATRRPGAAKNLIAELPEDLAADTLFLDGFEHVHHPGSLPKLRLSDILHPATCQEFFKTEMLGFYSSSLGGNRRVEPSSDGHPSCSDSEESVVGRKKYWRGD